jgi:hypothetical protein
MLPHPPRSDIRNGIAANIATTAKRLGEVGLWILMLQRERFTGDLLCTDRMILTVPFQECKTALLLECRPEAQLI